MPVFSKRTRFIGLAVALAGAAPLVAQQMTGPPGTPDVSRVTAGTYNVDPEHTMVRWEVDHLGITPYFGIFGGVTGSLTIDPSNPAAAKLDVTIPVSKVTTASAGLTSHLLRPPVEEGAKPDFFGANPADARFVSTSVIPDDDDADEATVIGNLTLNGVTRPVELEVEFYGAGKLPQDLGGQDQIGFTAETKIRRSDFGLDFMIPLVGDEVELDIVAAFAK